MENFKDQVIFQFIQLRSLFLGTTSTTVLFVNLLLDNTSKIIKKSKSWLKE